MTQPHTTVTYQSFFKIPRCIFTNPKYKSLSADAKILYMMMCDRAEVSAKNNWLDDDGRVYIFYTISNICESLGCSRDKAVKLLKELDADAGKLIWRKKRGGGQPDMIYVTQPDEDGEIFLKKNTVEKPDSEQSENPTEGVGNFGPGEVEKAEPNYNKYNYNNINYNKSNQLSDKVESDESRERSMPANINLYKKIIKSNIEYDCFDKSPYMRRWVDSIVEIMADVLSTEGKTFYINNIKYSHEAVKERLLELSNEHICYVYDVLHKEKPKIRKVREYVIAALYRAPETMEIWYQSQM